MHKAIAGNPVGKIAKKNSLKERVFVNFLLKLKLQCYIAKNTLLQTAFSAILATGKDLILLECTHFATKKSKEVVAVSI